MSRSGYREDWEWEWALIRWRGAVASAIRGKRGQAFLREMRDALDALPIQRLIRGDLETGGEVCAIGAVGKARSVDMQGLDPYDYASIAGTFGISRALVQEIEYENDEYSSETPERRYARMRTWIEQNIRQHGR